MIANSLEQRVRSHCGEFLCEQIGNKSVTKSVQFSHIITPPNATQDVPEIGDLKKIYSVFGSLTLYHDVESDEAAFYVAPPSEWRQLNRDFSGWIEGLDEEEEEELLPPWLESRIVFGEIPRTGNYILMATTGAGAGSVFEFEHDGFEFIELAPSLASFIEEALCPSASELLGMASHMRFITGDSGVQWWITELRDNEGRVVRNEP